MSAESYAVMVGRTECQTGRCPQHAILLSFAVIALVALAAAFVIFGSDSSSASMDDDWSYDNNSKVLTYTGPASMPDYKATDNPITHFNAHDAQSVTFVTNVTKIGDYAFKGSSFHDMTVPSGVKSIGKLSFGECYDLKTVSLPSGLSSIGSYAFTSCTMLRSITIPSSVVSIGSNAFFNCTALQSVDLPEYDSAYKDRTLAIQERTFYGCTSLLKITIPFHVTDIGAYAFCDCSSLFSITFEEKAILDDEGAIKGYNSKIHSIGDYAFKGCSSLENILIPDQLEIIGEDALKGTSKLKTIETRTNSVYRANEGVLFDIGLTILYHYPSAKEGTSYIIPSTVLVIDDTAFNGAKGLESLAIGQSELYYSENGVIFDAEQTKIIRYPEGKTDSSYTIPDTVIKVCANAFAGATNLSKLTMKTSAVDFESGSLCIGSVGNPVTLHVSAPDDYKIPERAYNSYTTLDYGGDSGSSPIVLIIVIACAAILLIVLIAVIVIRKRRI